jgi:hypothetical protein
MPFYVNNTPVSLRRIKSEVARLAVLNKTCKEIGAELGISQYYVRLILDRSLGFKRVLLSPEERKMIAAVRSGVTFKQAA